MKHPFWIINVFLLVCVLAAFIFILWGRVYIPEREEIVLSEDTYVMPEISLSINTSKIYENDLFGTYKKPLIQEQRTGPISMPIPPSPQPEVTMIPENQKPQFLDPLNITLKGIIILNADPSKNSALITDNKTNAEGSYKIGDSIDDAQIIRIMSNKIVLVRSNGQQEVLYLRQQDAQLDPAYTTIENWRSVVESIGKNHFVVNPSQFIFRIQDLSRFIDIVSLTTAYHEGISIGSRVGYIEPQSLGSALGLAMGDTIISINDIPATTTPNRLKIYQSITSAKEGDTITVVLVRNKKQETFLYTLREFFGPKEDKKTEETIEKREEKFNTLKSKYSLAPTAAELRKSEKERIMHHGKRLNK